MNQLFWINVNLDNDQSVIAAEVGLIDAQRALQEFRQRLMVDVIITDDQGYVYSEEEFTKMKFW